MSPTVGLGFAFDRAPGFAEVVQTLRASGAGFVAYGEISFLVNPDDSHSWQSGDPADEASILVTLTERAAAGIEVGISVSWEPGRYGGTLQLRPDSSSISFLPYADSPKVAPRFIGLGWYLDRLTALFAPWELRAADASILV